LVGVQARRRDTDARAALTVFDVYLVAALTQGPDVTQLGTVGAINKVATSTRRDHRGRIPEGLFDEIKFDGAISIDNHHPVRIFFRCAETWDVDDICVRFCAGL
jgi:hypothetical protein